MSGAMTPTWLSKILDEDRIGFVEEHGSRDKPVKKPKPRKGKQR